MPKGYPRQPDEVVIEVSPPPSRTGLRGRMDRLLRDYTMKAQALRIAADILDADERATALDTAPQKFLQAMNHRASASPDGAAPPTKTTKTKKTKNGSVRMKFDERLALVRAYLHEHDGADTHEVAEAVQTGRNNVLKLLAVVAKVKEPGSSRRPSTWTLRGAKASKVKASKPKKHAAPIHGPALMLFLLEKLSEASAIYVKELGDRLAEAGSPVASLRNLNGSLGVLQTNKWVKRYKDGAYIRTAKGTTRATALRQQLEADGVVAAGGYMKA